ncbi:MAG: hypothetical protein IJG15_01780 [Lachnospiraceae bacterium]|nr:hypothetical protein [Lachnospiraceae bacterium]
MEGIRAGAVGRYRRDLRHLQPADGYLTVFLALTVAVLLALILTLVEGARINAIRMKTEVAGNIAVRSVLGEFNRELLRQYDLYFVDSSYGTGSGSVENVEQHLRNYMAKNLEASASPGFGIAGDFTGTRLEDLQITGTRFAADDKARALREQVYAYMSADPAGAVLAEVLTNVDVWQGLLEDGSEWEKERSEARQDLRDQMRRAREDARENHTHEERQEAREEGDDMAEQAISRMDDFRHLPILRQVFGETSGLSMAAADGNVLSGRAIHCGTSLQVENAHGYPRADEVMFDLYIGEKCGCYTKALEKGRLRYQIEYILAGKQTDRENLEKIAERLLLIRTASNCACLFSDEARRGEAEMVAAVVALVLLNPELKEALTTVLLFAWAYLESVQDLRVLFDGGRVPLLKTPETWRTSLTDLLTPGAAVQRGGSGGREGLCYADYLQGLLFLEGSSVKSLRTMDIMEMDLRRTPGNAGFRMDWCLDAFSMTAQVRSRFGPEVTLTKSEGYN